MLCNLTKFSKIFPLGQEVVRFFVYVEPCSIEVAGCDEHDRLLIVKPFLQVHLGNRILLPRLQLMAQLLPLRLTSDLTSDHLLSLQKRDLIKLLRLVSFKRNLSDVVPFQKFRVALIPFILQLQTNLLFEIAVDPITLQCLFEDL